MHAVREELLDAQAACSGCPSGWCRFRRPARTTCTSARWARPCARAVADGFTHVAFGDLFLEDIRRYREEKLAGTRTDAALSAVRRRYGASRARDDRRRPPRAPDLRRPARARSPFVGRASSMLALLDDLPPGVDPCGERGEFHTFAWDGPMFSEPIRIDRRRDGRSRRLRIRRPAARPGPSP